MTDQIVNEIIENEEKTILPKETYKMKYLEQDIKDAYKTVKLPKRIYLGVVIYIILAGVLSTVTEGGYDLSILWFWGIAAAVIAFCYVVSEIRDKKLIDLHTKRAIASDYTFDVYNDRFIATVVYEDNTIEYVVPYNELTRVITKDKFVLVIYKKRIYIIKKEGLPQNSPLLHLGYIKKMHFDSKKAQGKEKGISLVLFILTLLSVHLSMFVSLAISVTGEMFDVFWLGALITSIIPTLSICYGYHLKKNGYSNYKKNTIAGFCILAILFLFGVSTAMAYYVM